MRAITVPTPGGPDALVWGEVPDPVAGPGEVVVDVAASAVNRADLLQRQGFYPPPPGASAVLGLECSGTVSEIGEGVEGWSVGDHCVALLAGGGYAERVAVQLGRSSVKAVEVVQGLAAGDQVILSDLSQWDSVERIRLR